MEDKASKIFTLKNSNTAEYKEKSSLFIAKAFPVSSEEEFESGLQAIKKEHYKARHHCYAFRLPDLFRYSDAGEPSGTAGIRILNAIDHFNMMYAGIVVVRYFGGVKLGAGPLGKAYYTSAYDSLKDAGVLEKHLCNKVSVRCPITEQHSVFSLLGRAGVGDIKTSYGDEYTFEFILKRELLPGLLSLSANMHKIKITLGEEVYI